MRRGFPPDNFSAAFVAIAMDAIAECLTAQVRLF
jgi:hypothetical protein